MPAPTRPVHIAIGERRRPQPFGQPGYLRVDSVHQGDLDGIKGLYHLNLVDEVTQFQFVGSARAHRHALPRPRPRSPAPGVPLQRPRIPHRQRFGVHQPSSPLPWAAKPAAHIDGSSNTVPDARLQALHIDEFTKSRIRRSNDNGPRRSKNGSVIRKHLGYGHIPSRYAERVNAFTQQILSPYLNFHRPDVSSPSMKSTPRGASAIGYRYPHANVMTPYEKLKSLPNAA